MNLEQYRFHNEYTGVLGSCTKPLPPHAEVRALFEQTFPAMEGWHAVVMPCGTGKTRLRGELRKAMLPWDAARPLNLVDADDVVGRHREYEAYLDTLEAKATNWRVGTWTKLNFWRDRLLSEKLPTWLKPGALNIVVIHGVSTAAVLGMNYLGTLVLEDKLQQEINERRTVR